MQPTLLAIAWIHLGPYHKFAMSHWLAISNPSIHIDANIHQASLLETHNMSVLDKK